MSASDDLLAGLVGIPAGAFRGGGKTTMLMTRTLYGHWTLIKLRKAQQNRRSATLRYLGAEPYSREETKAYRALQRAIQHENRMDGRVRREAQHYKQALQQDVPRPA